MTRYSKGSKTFERTSLTAFVVVMCSVTACAPDQVEPTVDDNVATDNQSIIGGRLDDTDWCVAELVIHDPGVSSGSICSCTFIATDTCLTAAHCVDPRVIGAGKVFEIHTETNAPLGVVFGTSTAFDPQWNPSNLSGGHDFGLVRTNAQWPFICNRGGFNSAKSVFLVGYGANTHSETGVGTRRSVMTSVVSSGSLLIESGNASVGACHGDSGGPAIQWRIDTLIAPIVTGVISFGTDQPPQVCVGSTFSGRLDSATAWIDQQVPCGNGICQPTAGENTSSCPFDCHVCGDGICAWGPEDASNCFGDCHCGNGVCDPGEDASNCWTDCPENCVAGPSGSRNPRC